MVRRSISQEDVIEAISKLEAQNIDINTNSIRKAIGRGSPVTINKFLSQWREGFSEVRSSREAKVSQSTIQNLRKNEESESTSETRVEASSKSDRNSIVHQDPIIQKLLKNSYVLGNEILNTISDEWRMISNEGNHELKVRKLYSALIKEQVRRESAEKVAKEARIYAETLKEQTTQRISDIRDNLKAQIIFLNSQIDQLKHEYETSLEYYREQLEKSNNVLAENKFIKKLHRGDK